MLDNNISWKQIADYYNTTYWRVYSWYRDNKDKFKTKEKKVKICPNCGKEFNKDRKFCCPECYKQYRTKNSS